MRSNVVRSPKLAQRRYRVRRERVRRKRRVAIAAVLAAAGGAAAWMMTGTAVFSISSVSVQGADLVSERAIVRASGLEVGGSALGADLAVAAERVADLPNILDASIERDGVSVVISVEERRPALRVSWGSRSWIVDRTGRPLLGANDADGIPTLTVSEIDAAGDHPVPTRVVVAVTQLWSSLSERDRARAGSLTMTDDGLSATVGRVEVRFGEPERIEAKVEAFHLVRKRAGGRGRVASIDVRSPERPAAIIV